MFASNFSDITSIIQFVQENSLSMQYSCSEYWGFSTGSRLHFDAASKIEFREEHFQG